MNEISTNFDRHCPKCCSEARVKSKLLLIGLQTASEERAGYKRPDQLAIDECRPQAIQQPPLAQFVRGFYCQKCGIGFIPDELVNAEVIEKRSRLGFATNDGLQTYNAVLWPGDTGEPARRIAFMARDLDDARARLELEHGKNLRFSLYNEEDAERKR